MEKRSTPREIPGDAGTAGFAYAGSDRRRAPRSPIAQRIWALPRVDFICAEHLPSKGAILAAVPDDVRRACADAVFGGKAELVRALHAIAPLLPDDLQELRCDLPAVIVQGDTANPEVHDHFFRIRRLGHGHPAGYLLSLLAARQVLQADVEEAATSLPPAELATIAHALNAAIAFGIGYPLPASSPVPIPATEPAATDHAIRRWVHGHQVFAALTQGLTAAFEAIHAAVGAGDADALSEAADFAGLVMRSCASALRFTGDFPGEVYEDLIRVSMDQPFQPAGFSGLLSSDHRHLVRRMKQTKPSMEALRERDPDRYERIVQALAEVYDAHKCVCSRFVGADKTSLMMVRDVGRTAIDHLDRFKTARLRAVGTEEPADSG